VSAGQWFWIIYVICLIFGVFLNWPVGGDANSPYRWRPLGWSVVLFVLLGLLGWGVFGPPIH